MSELPSSPAARAFFAALDSSSFDKKGADKKPQSSFIQKRIQSLGWRNRYSQDELYPIELRSGSDDNPHKFHVLQVQRGELEGTYGTGATVWPASVVMIKYLEKHAATLIKGKRIVDLGAGTAVTSIAAAILGASYTICTDGEPNVVQLARDNVDRAQKELHGSNVEECEEEISHPMYSIHGCPIDVQLYWWGSGCVENNAENCDVVLVSDCVLPKLYPIAPLVEALDQLLVKSDSTGILSYEYRYYPEYDPKEKFIELCDAKNLEVEVIPAEQQDSVYSTDDIEIWHVRRRA